MPIPLVLNGETFQYPINRDPSGWGSSASAWAQAVTEQLNTLVGPQDIVQTVANINNNQSSPTNVVGLSFDPATVKGAQVSYNVYRVTSTNETVEQGTMYISYKPVANTWDLVILGSRSSNVVFTINSVGQVQYTSDNMAGSSYNGTIVFRAIALS